VKWATRTAGQAFTQLQETRARFGTAADSGTRRSLSGPTIGKLFLYGSVANVKIGARGSSRIDRQAVFEISNSLEMNATCPAISPFGNHLICPLQIMFTVSMP